MAKMRVHERQTPAEPAAGLRAGDVVLLRSGGPKMTVTQVAGDGRVYLCWFGEAGQMHSQVLPVAAVLVDAGDD